MSADSNIAIMDTAAPKESPYGPRNEKLPLQLVNAIKATVKEHAEQERFTRRREVLEDRKNRFYEQGYQHVYEGRNGIFMQGTPGATINNGSCEIQCPNYIDDYNIYQPYLRVQEAILTQNPPGIDFRPLNPSRSEDIEAAQTAEGYRHVFDRTNNTKEIQTQIVRHMGMSGRVVVWTRTEAMGEKFGTNDADEPKQVEIATVHGALEARVFPMTAKSQEQLLGTFLYFDLDVKQAKAKYPGEGADGIPFADKIKANMSGLGESAYERLARLGVLNGSRVMSQIGDAFAHLCTEQHNFLRPAAFTGDKYDDPLEEPGEDDMVEGQPLPTVGEKLKSLFPNGCRAMFVGDVYVGSVDESMDDHIKIAFPYVGDGMYRMPFMRPMIVVQDRFNDNMNAAAEVWDHGWPSTWIHAGDVEYDAITEQTASPYAVRQLKELPAGMKAEDQFYREPNPELPATFMQFVEMLQGPLAQFILAAPPALFGAAMQDQKTASGYAQARSQAMGQQGLVWGAIQHLMAGMYYQAALAAAANPDHDEEIVIPAGDTSQTIRLDRLTKGKFGCYPDEDSSFPESTTAKRQTLSGIMTMAVQDQVLGAQISGSPDNWKTFSTLMGFPELVIPEAVVRDKAAFQIEILLQQSPLPPNPQEVQAAMVEHAAATISAQSMGGPPPPPFDPTSLLRSSVPVEDSDFFSWESQKYKEWLSSDDRRRQEAEGNIAGVQNVKLHWKEWTLRAAADMAAQAAAMPQPVPPSKPGPPQPPKPGGSSPDEDTAPPGAPGSETM